MMTSEQARALQAKLGVNADGIIGRNTLRALFSRCGASVGRAGELALSAAVHFPAFGILDTPERLAHFMAQLIHESGSFHYMEEIASGVAYEGRVDLGNVIAGDGKRYKGRGPIQLTGRANYRRYGQMVGFDFENHPEIVAVPSVGLLVACLYWQVADLNKLADRDDLTAITKRINGGLTGLADRKLQLIRMKALLT